MKKGLKTLLLYLLLIGTVILIVVYVSGSFKQKELTTFEVYTYFKEERVKEFVVSNDNVLTLTLYKKNADNIVVLKDGKLEALDLYSHSFRICLRQCRSW